MRLFGQKPTRQNALPGVPTLTARELKHQLDEGRKVVLVDVRQPTGFDVYPGTIPGSIRIPPSELPDQYGELPRDQPIVLFCT
ncbi:MAG TPA: rhodanese-like domain-containing protein [Chloroflexota bacterium]|nr:rhodanese-like domain-containing protein [Chloroflexota bacterium]